MKRIIVLLLSLIILLSVVPAVSAAGNMDHFQKNRTYVDGQFRDVSDRSWYAESVKEAYAYGLVNGNSATSYNPNGNITIAETLALSCRIHKMYHTGNAEFEQGSPWYQFYWDYAVKNKLVLPYDYRNFDTNDGRMLAENIENYVNMTASRTEFVGLLSRSLPARELKKINQIQDEEIPDLPMKRGQYAKDPDNLHILGVYQLYRAGILTGNDEYGTFAPGSYIQRSETAAIVTRMVDPSQRKMFKLQHYPITLEDLQGVWVRYDSNGDPIREVTIKGNKIIEVSEIFYKNPERAGGGYTHAIQYETGTVRLINRQLVFDSNFCYANSRMFGESRPTDRPTMYFDAWDMVNGKSTLKKATTSSGLTSRIKWAMDTGKLPYVSLADAFSFDYYINNYQSGGSVDGSSYVDRNS